MHISNTKNAFTLIELSIVLVIISLIVGGIIGGKSLIKSAEIQNAVKEMARVKTAINTFELQYDALPGDMSNATDYWPGVTNDGDGDRHYQVTDGIIGQEGAYLWHHLGLAEIYGPFSRPNASGVSFEYGITTAEIIPETASIAQYRVGDSNNRYQTPQNYIQMGKWQSNSSANVRCAAADTLTALAIDRKADDGIASSGYVFAYVQSTCSQTTATCTDHSGGGSDYQQTAGTVNYDKSNPSGGCRMAFLAFND